MTNRGVRVGWSKKNRSELSVVVDKGEREEQKGGTLHRRATFFILDTPCDDFIFSPPARVRRDLAWHNADSFFFSCRISQPGALPSVVEIAIRTMGLGVCVHRPKGVPLATQKAQGSGTAPKSSPRADHWALFSSPPPPPHLSFLSSFVFFPTRPPFDPSCLRSHCILASILLSLPSTPLLVHPLRPSPFACCYYRQTDHPSTSAHAQGPSRTSDTSPHTQPA